MTPLFVYVAAKKVMERTNLVETRSRIDCRSRMLQIRLHVGKRVQLDSRANSVESLTHITSFKVKKKKVIN